MKISVFRLDLLCARPVNLRTKRMQPPTVAEICLGETADPVTPKHHRARARHAPPIGHQPTFCVHQHLLTLPPFQ
jgi:hypothetical protein